MTEKVSPVPEAPQNNTGSHDHNSHAYAGGQTPAAPAAPVAVPAVPARPTLVGIAFWALMASAALLLIRIPVGMLVVNSAAHQEALKVYWGDYYPGMPAVMTSETMTFLVISGVISAALTVLFAFFIRKGHNWARIVLIVFAALWALNMRVQFTEAVPMFPAAWITLVSVLLTVAAIVLAFLPQSGAYFKSMKQYRKGKKLSRS